MKKGKRILAGLLAGILLVTSPGTGFIVEAKNKERAGNGKIVVDYNTSIGTGRPEIFGGSGTPDKIQDGAWNALTETMGLKIVKVKVDLTELFPNDADTIDTSILESYTHVAGSIFTRISGAGMKAMLEFENLPKWLDADANGIYDAGKKNDYLKIVQKFLGEAKNTGYEKIISHIEIVPDKNLSSAEFVEVYYETAKAVRAVLPETKIGGFGYELVNKNDQLPVNVKDALAHNKTENDQSLLQFVSVRGYQAEPTDGNSEKEIFGEFKEGRKVIRKALANQDMPLYMTGWSTAKKNAQDADTKITGAEGIKYHTSALFKAMRDGWNLVLFDGTVSKEEQPGSYTYEVKQDGSVQLMPFARVYNLLGNKLRLKDGNFKVVSTNMGSNWPVDDSIAMENAGGEPVLLMTNFGNAKSNIDIELKNVPYEDGRVTLQLYIASEDNDSSTVFKEMEGNVLNGIVNATIPIVPAGCAMGVIVKGETLKKLPAQSMYEFESQDNHFGGNMEIGWTTGASFNRTVFGFGGDENFVTLRNVMADGSGSYTAHLYTAVKNENILVSVNGGNAFQVNGSEVSLSKPVDFEVNLQAGSENSIKIWTKSGELKPDRLVLEAKDVELSVGIQNLGELEKQGDGKYVLPLKKTDFVVDARIFPESSAAGNKLKFDSSNPEIVEINETGLMMPKKTGESEITVSIENVLSAKQTFTVVVKNAVSSVTMQPTTLNLKQGKTGKITVEVLPEDAENRNISWSVSDESVITIVSQNQTGAEIRAVAESGTATVTAATENGKKASCTVIVSKPVEGGNIYIDFGNTVAIGHPEIFGVTHYPSVNPTDGDIGDHSKVWPMLTNEAGVKFMRADVRLQEILPVWIKTPNTNWERPSSYQPDQPNYVKSEYYYVTGPDGVQRKFNLEDYKADMEYYAEHGEYLNGLSNPDNWNTDRFTRWINAADAQGYEIMAMTFQIPEWLSAGEVAAGDPHTKKVCNGAPKDWNVYRDIIKKIYKLLRDKIDYYEFLNEPHWYIPTHGNQKNPEGKAYTGNNIVNEIAADQFYQAIDAIYEAEAEITGTAGAEPVVKLGGGADDSWGGDYGVLGTLFSKPYEKYADRVDFVSIHKYGERPANQDDSNAGANSRNMKFWIRQKTGRNMPVFLNEYNISTGQPTDETYGYKSVGWHTKNLIDMMVDDYSGGGYYTCYPADVPMDDYEASSGWVERGKGMYTWNDGNPYLANFTKAWKMMSKDLGLGEGTFEVKSTSIDGAMSQAVGMVNANGNAAAVINNYSSRAYDSICVEMKNLPYSAGSTISATIYQNTYDKVVEPVVVTAEVSDNRTANIQIPELRAWAVAGIQLNGTLENKEDTTYEFESYLNEINGQAHIVKDSRMSNGRCMIGAEGKENAVSILVGKENAGITKLQMQYLAERDAVLTYVIEGKEKTVPLSAGHKKIEIIETLPQGKTEITFYISSGNAMLDCVMRTDMDKSALQKLVDQEYTKDGYTIKSWEVYEKAKTEAMQVLENETATAEEVYEAYQNLSNAIEGLVLMVDLKALVEKVEPLCEQSGKYETASWIQFFISLDKAKKVLEDKNATQEKEIEAYYELEQAHGQLKKIVQGESENLIEGKLPVSNTNIVRPEAATDGNVNTSDADGKSFTQLEAGMETGGSDNGYSNWKDVYLQYDLGAAYLVNKVDVYRTIYHSGDYIRWKNCKIELSISEDFTEETTVLLAEDNELRTESGQTTPQEILPEQPVEARYIRVSGRGHQGSWGGYSNKVNISEIQVYGTFFVKKDYLTSLLEDAKHIQNDNYTTGSWNRLQGEISNTEKLLEQETFTQQQINDAAASLTVAMGALKKKADSQALQKAISALEDKMGEQTWNKISADEQDKFNQLLEQAKELVNEESTDQTKFDQMTEKVKIAVDELNKLYEKIHALEQQKKVLADAIENAKKVNLGGYTKESIEAFKQALLEAQKVLEEGTTKEEYREAFEKLEAAINGLRKPEPEQPNEPNVPNGGAVNGNDAQKPPAVMTGDRSNWSLIIFAELFGILIGCSVILANRKRRKEE